MIDDMKRNWLKWLGLTALGGCAQAQPRSRSVTAVVINYTDRYIGDVWVDGVWVGAADAFGGDGNRVEGLLAPANPNRKVVVKVKWRLSGLYDIASNTYSRLPEEEFSTEVPVSWPYPPNPNYLVLHFYPDGRVEAELEADQIKRRIPKPPGYHRNSRQ
ncbi:DUF3304 domain-containing protein [Roseateles sp. BYS87W]|uniref:DUF3304 domain-containing protein n=1 Tax=Pelomonas baiyunensis TaxID=3299026 RepID=A0ABW7H4I9_9BURK